MVIVLDWTKPSGMVRELLHWLGWVDSWAERTAKRDGEESNELRERRELLVGRADFSPISSATVY